ncbi:hypothetical protein BG005_006596 [Podila minutissima]|nr:hypothetical protein BG005_006596 [Podila minutissima]
MLTSTRLPLECLHHIVKQLVVDEDIQTLITLLRVNKFVCLATLPFVYEDPFHWFACYRDIPWLYNRLGTHTKYDKIALGRGHNSMRDADDECSVNSLTLTYLNLDMFRETSWVLCAPILEQLKSIVIPLSDVGRYLDNVHRFPSLTSVTIKMDDLGDIADYAVQSLDLVDLLKAQQWMEKRRQDLESAVQFVQRHTVIFRGTLKEVFVPLDGSWNSHVQACPASYLTRMLDYVQSLIDPKELNDDNLSQFAAKIEATNVEHVQSICFLSLYDDWYQRLQSTPFLHRCRSLRSLGIPTLGPDSFKWAARNQGQDSRRVPLKEISIWAEFEPLGNELNDIGQGLETLEVFKIQGFLYHPQDPPVIPPIKLGHGGWRLPFLTILIVRGSPATCFHPDTLHSTKKLAMLVLGGPHGFSRIPRPSFFQLQEQSQQEQSHAENTIPEDSIRRELSIPDFLTGAVSVQNFAKRDAQDSSTDMSLEPEEGHKRLMWREPCFSPSESTDNRKYTTEQEEGKEDPAHIEETIRAIENLVRDDHILQKCLDRIFEQQRIQQQQLHQRAEALQEFEGAPIVRVPSLKKLDLYGHWKIPEVVLQLMLGTVFRNVETLTVFDCKGYGMDALVRTT